MPVVKLQNLIRNNRKEFAFAIVIVLCLILLFSTVALLSGYSENLEEQAKTKVETYATQTEKTMAEHFSFYAGIAREASHNAANYPTKEGMVAYFREIKDPENARYYGNVEDVRYFKYDESAGVYAEYAYGEAYTEKESEELLELLGQDRIHCTGVAYDSGTADKSMVGFYAPIEGSDFADCMVIYYPIGEITAFSQNVNRNILKKSEFVVFCSQKNRVKQVLYDSENAFSDQILFGIGRNGEISKQENILEILGTQIHNAETERQLEAAISTGGSDVIPIRIGGVSYMVAISGGGEYGGMYSVGVYLSSKAYESGYWFAIGLFSTLIVCFVVLIAALLYLLISRRNMNRKISEIGSTDPVFGTPTMLKFEKDVEMILATHKATRFAVILAEIRFFNYISENFGKEASGDVLQYLKLICQKSLRTDEAYAYLADGRFVLLYHYREQRDLKSRLRGMDAVANKYPGLRQKYSIRLQFGVYEIDRTVEQTVRDMVNRATVAKNSATEFNSMGEIKFYTEKLREDYLQSADMEVRMETALKNEEFKVFFQPKYHIGQNRQDGCEALVRWHESETDRYRSPDAFLTLFEANGFIVEVDKYVYCKACEYIHEAAERGDLVYPVSVNVSRITANQPDFIEYYSRIKRQNKIPDRFLTLEFTESFAFEDYDALKEIIDGLHRNGFLCSIDDFGSGYSSYNILKELPMDELKLDRFFIRKGLAESRDNAIIESVICVAKALGMKITQEGVETEEEVRRLRSLGCDVIQGYYYSEPLSPEDYRSFVNSKKPRADKT